MRVGTWQEAREIIVLTSSRTFTGTSGPDRTRNTATLQWTWGLPFVLHGTGCQALIENFEDTRVGHTNDHFVTFDWPTGWDTGNQFVYGTAGNGYITSPQNIKARFLPINPVLTVDDNCNWSLDLDEIQLQVDDDGMGYVTVYTIPGTSFPISGSGFDYRYNKTHLEATAAYLVAFIPAGPPTCNATYAGQPVYDYQVLSSVNGGYEHKTGGIYIQDDISLYSSSQPNECASDCVATEVPATSVSGLSNDVTIEVFTRQPETKSTDTDIEVCPSVGCIRSRLLKTWGIVEEYIEHSTSVGIVGRDWPINSLRKQTSENCNIFDPPITTDTSEFPTVVTYCEETREASYSIGTKNCQQVLVNTCLCTPPAGPIDPDPNPLFCSHESSTILSWPTAPSCGGSKHPDCVHFKPTNEFVWAKEIGTDIYVYKSQFRIPVSGYITSSKVTSSGINTRPALFIATNGIFYVSYELSDNIVYRFSTDFGKTWSSESTLFTGCYQPRHAIGQNSERVHIAFKYDSGTSGPGKIRVVSVNAGGVASTESNALDSTGTPIAASDKGHDISFSGDRTGAWLMDLYKDGDADLSHWVSHDFGLTWTEVTI